MKKVVVASVAVVLMAGCGASRGGLAPLLPARQMTTVTASGRPTTVPTSASTADGPLSAYAGPIGYCAQSDVRITGVSGSGAAGKLYADLILTVGAMPCMTFAHPGLTMLDASRTPLSTHVEQTGYDDGGYPAPTVELPARSTQYVGVSYTYMEQDTVSLCAPHAAFLEVVLGPASSVRIPALDPDQIPMNPCDGLIFESPIGGTMELMGTDP